MFADLRCVKFIFWSGKLLGPNIFILNKFSGLKIHKILQLSEALSPGPHTVVRLARVAHLCFNFNNFSLARALAKVNPALYIGIFFIREGTSTCFSQEAGILQNNITFIHTCVGQYLSAFYAYLKI